MLSGLAYQSPFLAKLFAQRALPKGEKRCCVLNLSFLVSISSSFCFLGRRRWEGEKRGGGEGSEFRALPVRLSGLSVLFFFFFLLFEWSWLIISRNADNSAHNILVWRTEFIRSEGIRGAEFKLSALWLRLGGLGVWWTESLSIRCINFISCAPCSPISRTQRNWS